MASIQYDIVNNLSYDSDGSHIRTATTLVKANPITDSEKAVERAWNDIFHNNNLSVENFNAIITNFQTNSAYVVNLAKI